MKKVRYLVCVVIVLCITDGSICQTASVGVKEYDSFTFKETLPHVTRDFLQMMAFPTRMDAKSGLILTGFTSLTAGLMLTLDDNIATSFKDYNQYSGSEAAHVLTGPGRLFDRMGPDFVILGTGSALIGSGFLFKDQKLVRTGWTTVEALVFTQLTTGLLKFAFGRNRPFVTANSLRFDPGKLDNENPELSMPSGHTARAFAFSTVLASSFDTYLVKVPVYALAASVAVQRIASNEHWASDVLVGGSIGYMIGRYLSKRNGLSIGDHQLKPLFASGKIGFSLRF